MTNRAESEKLNWPRWAQVLLIAALALLIGNRLIFIVDAVAVRSGLVGELATTGGSVIGSRDTALGFGKVVSVTPGGPLDKAGVRVGDHLRHETSYRQFTRTFPGERIDVTLDRGGIRSEIQVTTVAVTWDEPNRQRNLVFLLNALAALVSTMIGCFILWRGWGNLAAMLLGTAVPFLGIGGFFLPPWANAPIIANPMFYLLHAGRWLALLTVPFSMRMFEEGVAPLPRKHWRFAMLWLAITALLVVAIIRDIFAPARALAWAGGPDSVNAIMGLVGFLICVSYLIAGWRRSGSATRNRFALIVFALTAYQLAYSITLWNLGQTGSFFARESSPWLNYGNALMMGLIAPGLLAYAVLRHKLFDLGFAVNRTLVFGAVGLLLLVSFALIEWAIKQAIPKVWYGGSVYISAVIAVGLYLTFNRLHHRVEHAIERLFFRKWQLNEAALKRFVAAAAHVEKPEALAGNFAAELVCFSGGAVASLYARAPEGHYASAGGETIDADDPALAALRAEQGAVVPAEVSSPIEAALALPMMHQAALAGFALLGPKPSGEDYRPDEIDNMAWATQQVGLDMQAIRVRELEQTVTRLEVQNGSLESHNRSLTDILAGRQTAGASGRAK